MKKLFAVGAILGQAIGGDTESTLIGAGAVRSWESGPIGSCNEPPG